jgi:uncharacterized delta-60 repeat protein
LSFRNERRAAAARPALMESLESRRLLDGAVLDPSFGSGGRAAMPFPDGRLLGLQPGGKVLISRYNPSRGGNQLMRLNADGTLDATFTDVVGDFPMGGDFNGGGHRVNPNDGRIVYWTLNASSALTKISVLRADGSRDTSFDGDGIFDLADRGVTFVDEIRWQGDKLLYQAGSQITRLNADGSVDTTFGDDGVVTAVEPFFRFQVDADGRIYQMKDIQQEPTFPGGSFSSRAEITRLTVDGDLDTSYGNGGRAIANTESSPVSSRDSIGFQVAPDGSLFHLTSSDVGEKLTWLDDDGAVVAQNEFVTREDAPGSREFLPVRFLRTFAVQPDGKVLLLGGGQQLNGDWLMTRLNADLTIDHDYGVDGMTVLGLQVNSFSRPVVLPDGKLLIGARRTVAADQFEVDRFASGDVTPPTVTLDEDGVLTATASEASENVSLYIRRRDGRLMVRVGDFVHSFKPSGVKRIAVFAGGGADVVAIGEGIIGAYVDAGDGRDVIHGGQGNDILFGGTGPDRILGFDGNDKLLGGGGNDYLLGGAGKDFLFGNGGVDKLSGGGGNDRLFGGAGADRIFGGAGGSDAAADSDEDDFADVETLLHA